jgi:hypothetical protein
MSMTEIEWTDEQGGSHAGPVRTIAGHAASFT